MRKYMINKNYSIMAMSKLVSMFGSLIQEFALSLYVLNLTGSATKFAAVLAVTIIPQLLIGPLSGVLVDWLNKKTLLILLDLSSGILTTAAIVFMAFRHTLPMHLIYILVIFLSSVSVIYNITTSALTVSIVASKDLVKANSTNSFIDIFTQTTSSLLGGILYGFLGLMPCLIINGISFFLSAILQIFLVIKHETSNKKNGFKIKGFFSDLSVGFFFIQKQKLILRIVICAFFINFALSPFFSIGVTFIAKKIFIVSDMQYGFLQSIMVAGTLPISLIVPKLIKKFSLQSIFFYGILFTSLLIGLISATYSQTFIRLCGSSQLPYVLFVFLLVLVLNINIIVNISNKTLYQQLIPKDMMGRVTSVMTTICMAAIPLGQALAGKLFDSINPVIVGIIVFLIVIATAITFRFGNDNHKKEMEGEQSF